jgi:hypothetical protein
MSETIALALHALLVLAAKLEALSLDAATRARSGRLLQLLECLVLASGRELRLNIAGAPVCSRGRRSTRRPAPSRPRCAAECSGMPEIDIRKRGACGALLGMIRRRYGPAGREIEQLAAEGKLDGERDQSFLMDRGIRMEDKRLLVSPQMTGQARIVPNLRILDRKNGDVLFEICWSGPGCVSVIDWKADDGNGKVLADGRLEYFDGEPAPAFVVLGRDAHPEDISAELLFKLEAFGAALAEQGVLEPRQKPERYAADLSRWAVLEAAEALEQRDGRPPTNEAIARALQIPVETARRLRHEASERFSVEPRPISQREELRRLIAEGREDARRTGSRYDLPDD